MMSRYPISRELYPYRQQNEQYLYSQEQYPCDRGHSFLLVPPVPHWYIADGYDLMLLCLYDSYTLLLSLHHNRFFTTVAECENKPVIDCNSTSISVCSVSAAIISLTSSNKASRSFRRKLNALIV